MIALSLLTVSCKNEVKQAEEEKESHEENVVELTEQQLNTIGVKFGHVEQRQLSGTINATGTLRLSPQDRAQTALDILEPMVDKYPENLPLKEALGRAYLKGRQFDLARKQFQDIQKVDPEYPDIQQRIQESNITRPAPINKNDGLTANLNRAVDSLRETMAPSAVHDFSTMLGHYVVRYGATPKEFFKKYSIGNFRPVAKNVWQESFFVAPYMHTYTVVFDSLNHFREVHVVVYDSSSSSNHFGIAPEIYTRLLKQNSRICRMVHIPLRFKPVCQPANCLRWCRWISTAISPRTR